jgi:putative oxygen-independent coproporphyrinogen III oxidase
VSVAPGSGAAARPFGVYVHFPYCLFHCPYCDFAVSTERAPQARYTEAVLAELAARAPAFAASACCSLYLGGGTPSLWDPEQVAQVVAAVRGLGLPPTAEVTLEANPESADAGRWAAFREAGVNRLSIGVQSFDRIVLGKLGRRHGPEAAERAVRVAAEVLENVAVDLIYGGRRSSVVTARGDAERLGRLPVVHVSAYALTLDAEALAEEVPLARLLGQGRIAFPSEEETLAQARAIRGALRRAGLRRYEISNFARPGFDSTHNRLYWSSAGYLGVGVGAFGFAPTGAGGRRWGNHRTPAAWFEAVEAGRLPTAEEEHLGPAELARERVLLALRTAEGLDESAIPPSRRGELAALLRRRLAVRRGGRLALTSRGMDLHSAVVERLIE